MLVDLLSTDCQVSYNCNLAQVVGLHASIYLTELINISRKATIKNKLLDGKYFIVDRNYIEQRTTFDATEQKGLEKTLSQINVLSFGAATDSVYLDLDVLSGLVVGDADIQQKVKVAVQNTTTKKVTGKQRCAQEMKKYIYTTNSELYNAYSEWIDTVCDKLGWMSQKAVTVGQQTVDKYAKGDLDIALKLLEIATVSGWRDINFAISKFEESYKSQFAEQRRKANSPAVRPRKEVGVEIF